MNALKLGTEGLESAEISRVRILLRLLAGNPHFKWVYATEGPFDAILCSNAWPVARCAITIDLLPEGSIGGSDCLVRPIEADALEALLFKLQGQLQPTVFAELSPIEFDIFAAPHKTRATSQATVAEAPRPPQATPKVFEVLKPQDVASAGDSEQYRLNRWPPQAVLRDSKDRLRLANLISRKSLSVEQLVQSSGIATAEVQAFLTVLQSFGIVNVELIAPSASVPRMSTDTCVAPRQKQKQKRSFLSALRRKLGI